jgi:hypothetical protein
VKSAGSTEYFEMSAGSNSSISMRILYSLQVNYQERLHSIFICTVDKVVIYW